MKQVQIVNRTLGKASGYVILTLLFLLIGTSALWFSKNIKPPDYTSKNYVLLSRIKSALLSHLTLQRDAASSISPIGGLTDYPGAIICPLDPNELDKGLAQTSCSPPSSTDLVQGLLPWGSLGLNKPADFTGSMFWLIVDPVLTEDKKANINSELKSTLYWKDTDNPVAAIIFSPQKTLSTQTRSPLSNTNLPATNVNHYLEINTVDQTLSGQPIKVVSPAPNSNDLVVTISRNEWLNAIEHRITNLLSYCINTFMDENKNNDLVVIPAHQAPASLPSGYCYNIDNPSYPTPNNILTGINLGAFNIFNDASFPSTLPSILLSDIKKDQGNICKNIFNRYTKHSPTESWLPPLSSTPSTCPSTPSSTPSFIHSGNLSSFPTLQNTPQYNTITAPNNLSTPSDHWIYQWRNSLFFDVRPDIEIRDHIYKECWKSDMVVVLASEPLQNSSTNQIRPFRDYNDLFEQETPNISSNIFEIKPHSSEFNDIIRFNRNGSITKTGGCPW